MGLFKSLEAWFGLSQSDRRPVTQKDVSRQYAAHPTLADYLPWAGYSDRYKTFLLEDRESLAVAFELTPMACEAKSSEMMAALSKGIAQAIKNAIPREKEHPWVLQVFAQNSHDLTAAYQQIENYTLKGREASPQARAHLDILKQHYEFVSRPGGIFEDELVMGQSFRGTQLKVYAILYRRYPLHAKSRQRRTAIEDSQRVARKFSEGLRNAGLKVKRLRGEGFYEWLVRWFNPAPKSTRGDVSAWLQKNPWQPETERRLGWQLTSTLFSETPESTATGWCFNGWPHKVITIETMKEAPVIGHLSAERQRAQSEQLFNLLDRMPEGSIFSLHITVIAQSEVEAHLKKIEGSAVGHHAQALLVKNDVRMAEQAIATGNDIYPLAMAVYCCGRDEAELAERESVLENLLTDNAFAIINEYDVFPIDSYLRFLPMNYQYAFDRKNSQRAQYY